MKKIATFVMTTIVALICTLTFAACSGTSGTDAPAASNDVVTLVMDKRYINEEYVNKTTEKQRYYVFHADGTGEFAYHYDYDSSYSYSDTHNHLIIHFIYTYVDDDKSAVACFYDSIERLTDDDGKYTATTWSSLVTVSNNVLTTVGTSYVFWINEDYLKTLPNFRK